MDTTFINGTVVEADWLNEVNRDTYKDLPNVKNAPYSAVGNGVADDTVAITTAVAFAFTNNTPLNWPPGTYLTTANIPNFHNVNHVGPGIVKRGTDLFYITPKEGNVNIIYIATTGSNTNDGFSASQPLASLQAAFNILINKGFLDGTWRLKLAGGTYTGTASRARIGPANDTSLDGNDDPYRISGAVSKNYIIIEGPDVGYVPATTPAPVPTAIFDGGGAAALGIQLVGSSIHVLIKSVKLINYNGSGNSAGITAFGTWLRTENVHTNNNSYDMVSYQGRIEVKGGILANAQVAAIRSLFNNVHEIGNQLAGAPGEGPFINNTTIGLHAQEGATGHSDFVNYDNCSTGIYVAVNSRVNYNKSVFTNCNRGIRSLQGYIYTDSPATFVGCTENKVITMFGQDANRTPNANAGLAFKYITTPVVRTGNTSSVEILKTTILAGDLAPTLTAIRYPQHIEFEFFGVQTGAHSKQHKLRYAFNLIGSIITDPTDVGPWRVRGAVYFVGTNAQYGYLEYTSHNFPSKVNNTGGSAANAKDFDWDFAYEQQLTDPTDTITTHGGFFKVWG